jgi:uncharacterized repeat protein (TIGR03803 family)
VFQLIPPKQKGGSWTEKILYHFQGNKDGYAPHGDLVVDASGNLYGATNFGGGGGQSTCDSFYPYCGTVFEVSPPKTKGGKWTEKVLYSFQNKTDGAVPNGSLVFDKQGALYGTTYCGGSVECQDLSGGSGVGFRLKPPSQNGGRWSYKLLYSFKGNPGDGGNSRAGMIFDAKGSLYGTTQAGGNPRGDGTVFQLTRHGKGRWKESIFHTFNFNDAVFPMAELVFGASGELYGTASQGGANGGGAVFQMKFLGASGWTYQRLYDFSAVPDGNEPESSLIVDHAGSLYGATLLGGTGTACTFGCGTVYELQP